MQRRSDFSACRNLNHHPALHQRGVQRENTVVAGETVATKRLDIRRSGGCLLYTSRCV